MCLNSRATYIRVNYIFSKEEHKMTRECITNVEITGTEALKIKIDINNSISTWEILKKIGYREAFLEDVERRLISGTLKSTILAMDYGSNSVAMQFSGTQEADPFIKLLLTDCNNVKIKSASYDGNNYMAGNDYDMMWQQLESPSPEDELHLKELAKRYCKPNLYNDTKLLDPIEKENNELYYKAHMNLYFQQIYDKEKINIDWSCFREKDFDNLVQDLQKGEIDTFPERDTNACGIGKSFKSYGEIYINGIKITLGLTANFYSGALEPYISISVPQLEFYNSELTCEYYPIEDSVPEAQYDEIGTDSLREYYRESFPDDGIKDGKINYEEFLDEVEFIFTDYFENERNKCRDSPIAAKSLEMIEDGSYDFMMKYEKSFLNNQNHELAATDCVKGYLEKGCSMAYCLNLLEKYSPVIQNREDDYAFNIILEAKKEANIPTKEAKRMQR